MTGGRAGFCGAVQCSTKHVALAGALVMLSNNLGLPLFYEDFTGDLGGLLRNSSVPKVDEPIFPPKIPLVATDQWKVWPVSVILSVCIKLVGAFNKFTVIWIKFVRIKLKGISNKLKLSWLTNVHIEFLY